MKIDSLRTSVGIALIESAGILSILSIFIFSAFALTEKIRTTSAIKTIVDNAILDNRERALLLTSGSQIILDHSGIQQHITQMHQLIAKSIHEYLAREFALTINESIIEAGYYELIVDRLSGNLEMQKSHTAYSVTTGSKLFAQLLDNAFLKYIGDPLENRGLVPHAWYATPNLNYFLDNSDQSSDNYLPTGILVGAGVQLSLKNSFLAHLLSAIGGQEPIQYYKVITLRGEISDE